MQTASFSPPLICTPALSTKEKARSESMDTDSAPVCHRKRKRGREGRGGGGWASSSSWFQGERSSRATRRLGTPHGAGTL